jgi:hypothetical protein
MILIVALVGSMAVAAGIYGFTYFVTMPIDVQVK